MIWYCIVQWNITWYDIMYHLRWPRDSSRTLTSTIMAIENINQQKWWGEKVSLERSQLEWRTRHCAIYTLIFNRYQTRLMFFSCRLLWLQYLVPFLFQVTAGVAQGLQGDLTGVLSLYWWMFLVAEPMTKFWLTCFDLVESFFQFRRKL